MGLFKSIGKAFKSVGKAVKGVVKGVAKFAKSPFGKLLINVGLSYLTGGMGGLLAKGLGALGGSGGLGGMLGSLASGGLGDVFKGFAGKFLGQATDFLTKNGLSSVAGFLSKAGSSGDLLSMAKSIFQATQGSKTDQTTGEIVKNNLLQLFAKQAAQLVTAQ